MVDEELLTLASVAGLAIVKSMATDGWSAVRDRVARIFRRAGKSAETVDAALEADARGIVQTPGPDRNARRNDLAMFWSGRVVGMLEDCSTADRAAVAAELRTLIESTAAAPEVVTGQSISDSSAGRDINQVGSVEGGFTTGSGNG